MVALGFISPGPGPTPRGQWDVWELGSSEESFRECEPAILPIVPNSPEPPLLARGQLSVWSLALLHVRCNPGDP